jgi:hypothetical protein
MPFEIRRNNKGYQIYNKDTGRTFSKKALTEQNAIKQFKILNKYLHTLEGSGMNRGEIIDTNYKALTDLDIKNHLGDNVKIISHQDLKDYKSIDELMPNKRDVVVIIWESKPNYGHWTLLSKYIDEYTNLKTIEYFDSYSYPINEPLKWIKPKYKNKIDSTDYLTPLLLRAENNGYDIIYNAKNFQNKYNDVATCGRHVISRAVSIMKYNQSLSNYIKMFNELKSTTGFDYDSIVSQLVP